MHCPFPTFVRTSVIPECFYRESTAHQHTPGFPLKTCGNDMYKTCLPSVYSFLPPLYPLLAKGGKREVLWLRLCCAMNPPLHAVIFFLILSRRIYGSNAFIDVPEN